MNVQDTAVSHACSELSKRGWDVEVVQNRTELRRITQAVELTVKGAW